MQMQSICVGPLTATESQTRRHAQLIVLGGGSLGKAVCGKSTVKVGGRVKVAVRGLWCALCSPTGRKDP